MKTEEFDKILRDRLQKINYVLAHKAKEYASDSDRLYNFKRSAEIERNTPAQSLWGKATKHLVSIIDMIEASSYKAFPQDYIDEKIGDMINYLILLEAILKE